jgi:hypothetical protein
MLHLGVTWITLNKVIGEVSMPWGSFDQRAPAGNMHLTRGDTEALPDRRIGEGPQTGYFGALGADLDGLEGR